MLLLDKALTDALPLLFDFLGVSDPADPSPRMDPEARQRRLLALAKRVHMAQSRREPVVLLFEDLHWIDDGSAPYVETLVEAMPGTRTLLLLNFRPEYHAGWMQKSYYQQLPLLPLGTEASAELLRDLLGSDPSLAALTDRIQERVGGNPFFIEEIVQGLVETGSLEGTRGAYRLRAAAALHPDKLDERAALLAYHWEAAGDALEAARWNRRAAEWVRATDLAAALGHWRKVRTLVDKVPESAETMELGLAACTRVLSLSWTLGISPEEAAILFADGKDLANRSGARL